MKQHPDFIEIDGKQIEFELEVVDEKRPYLIFLHEGLGCIQMWRDFPTKLAQATNCNRLVYSRWGYGQSDPISLPRPVNYMHTEGIDILPKIITKHNIGQHILIGHSDGGSIALINAGGIQSPNLLALITEAAHVFNEQICVDAIDRAKDAYHNTNLREKLAKYHKNVDVAFWGWNKVWRHPDFWHWNLEEYLPTINVPFLAIQGKDDQYGTIAQIEAIISQAPHAQSLLLPDCNHSPHIEQPEQTLATMTLFIQNILGE